MRIKIEMSEQHINFWILPSAIEAGIPPEKKILYDNLNDCVNMALCNLNGAKCAKRPAAWFDQAVEFIRKR